MSENKEGIATDPNSVTFFYKKSNYFRVTHADGVTGNITPTGGIFVSFYNERESLPDQVTYQLEDDGQVGDVVDVKTTSDGFLRELEIGIVLDINTAKSLVYWLSGMIERGDDYIAEAATERGSDEIKL